LNFNLFDSFVEYTDNSVKRHIYFKCLVPVRFYKLHTPKHDKSSSRYYKNSLNFSASEIDLFTNTVEETQQVIYLKNKYKGKMKYISIEIVDGIIAILTENDPNDTDELILSDDGVTAVSTASATSLGVVRAAGDVGVNSDGDMFLQPDVAEDTIIGTRTLVNNDGNISLMTIAAKTLTQWLQAIRDNIKALFAHVHTGTDGTAKISYANLTGTPNIPAAANNGTLTIQQGGATIATFTANQAADGTADIPEPNDGTFTYQLNGVTIGNTFTANGSAATYNVTLAQLQTFLGSLSNI
jgi:hypothetical protein